MKSDGVATIVAKDGYYIAESALSDYAGGGVSEETAEYALHKTKLMLESLLDGVPDLSAETQDFIKSVLSHVADAHKEIYETARAIEYVERESKVQLRNRIKEARKEWNQNA